MANLTQPLNFLKKNRISLISAIAFLVAFCCIFAFAGNSSGETSYAEGLFSESASSDAPVSDSGDPQGIGLYIDGSFIAAVSSESDARAALEEILDIRVSSLGISSSDEIYFNNDIEFISGNYPVEAFTDSEGVAALLGKKNSFVVNNTVFNYNGELVPAKLSVCSVATYTETVTLEYSTKTIYTDAIRDGATKVVSKGYNGEGEETYRVISVDGVETERQVVSLDVTVAPSDEVIRVGTRSDGKDVASLATFQKPYDGIITSYVGPRWGRTHNGIDIVAEGRGCNGDPVYAAADGVVVRADRYNGYGNCVIIDHGDGIQTLYAHFSSISVSAGDVVKAGDEVGKIGSTGNSTGPHLHFEVRIDGEFVNPLIFVDYE